MRRTLRMPVVVALMVALLLAAGVVGASSAGAQKLQKACTLVKPADIEAVVGATVGDADGAGSKLACSFEFGDGLGSPGGGLVVVQHYPGAMGKGIWGAARQSGEKVGKVVWGPDSGIAMVAKKGRVAAVSVTITGGADETERAQSIALAEVLRTKL